MDVCWCGSEVYVDNNDCEYQQRSWICPSRDWGSRKWTHFTTQTKEIVFDKFIIANWFIGNFIIGNFIVSLIPKLYESEECKIQNVVKCYEKSAGILEAGYVGIVGAGSNDIIGGGRTYHVDGVDYTRFSTSSGNPVVIELGKDAIYDSKIT